MDGTEDKKPAQTPEAEERAEQGRKNRDEMDEAPPHGTDPLHEGP